MIIRWVCEKDNKKWIYPVDKCIYCKCPVKKQVSRRAKVIGITKVNIPSPLHPITPYNVMLLEDEFGNRMPKKTMKDYKIGDYFSIEKAKTDSAVIITKIKYDLGEALDESLALLDSFDISGSDKVIITPSVLEPAYPYQAVNTNPKLIDEIIRFLKKNNVTDIAVGAQAMLGNDVVASAKKAGIIDVCKKHDVKMVDFSKSEYAEREHDGVKFNIAKEAFERKIINVPVMKANSQITVSGAMENMLRMADEKTQREMFANDIEKMLPRLIMVMPRFLTIGDATIGMQGQGPTSLGEPAFLNMLLIGKDPIAVDSVFAEAGMFAKPEYLKEASRIGAGNNNVIGLEIIGNDLEAIKYRLKDTDKEATAHPRIKLIDGKADPYIFNSALRIAGKLAGLTGYETNIAIGKFITEEMIRGKGRVVAYGNDAIKKIRELNITPVAEIPEDIGDIEKIVLLKGILENPDKRSISAKDKIKSKLAGIGAKIKAAF